MTITIFYILWDSTMKTIWNITEKRFLAPWEYDVKSASHSIMSDSLWPHGLYNPQNSQGQNTGVGSLSLLQGIFPTQGLNPGLPHCRQILYQLNHKGNPRILEWVAYPFSSGSSPPRNRTGVSCFAGGFFTNWAIREASDQPRQHIKKQRHHYANKGPYSQSFGFSSSHVWKWELDHKEGWAPKKLMFLNCGAGKDSKESLGQQGDQTSQS